MGNWEWEKLSIFSGLPENEGVSLLAFPDVTLVAGEMLYQLTMNN